MVKDEDKLKLHVFFIALLISLFGLISLITFAILLKVWRGAAKENLLLLGLIAYIAAYVFTLVPSLLISPINWRSWKELRETFALKIKLIQQHSVLYVEQCMQHVYCLH